MTRKLTLVLASLLIAACGSVEPTPPPSGGAPSVPPTGPVATPSPAASRDAPTSSPAEPSAEPSPAATPTSTPVAGQDRWVRAGRFTTERMDTQLALLGTGEVVAAGDEATCGVENAGSDSSELWHPGRSRWTATDRLPSLRTMTTLVALADGRAMVVGGANEAYVAKSSSVVYDPETRRWTPSGLLHTARMTFAVAPLPDGGVLVAGGLLIDGRQRGHALASVETWDPGTGEWTEVAPLSTVRLGADAVTLADGRVLVVGGDPKWGADSPLATAEIYDPVTGRWRSAGRLVAPRTAFSLVALPDGGALLVGGERGEDRAERFDPATRTWTRARGRSPIGARPAAAVLHDGRVLVVSGTVTRLYDPTADRWRRGPGLPGGMADASAVALPDGSVLVAGGWTQPPHPGDTPGCPGYSNRSWRFVPGS